MWDDRKNIHRPDLLLIVPGTELLKTLVIS